MRKIISKQFKKLTIRNKQKLRGTIFLRHFINLLGVLGDKEFPETAF